MGLRWCRMGSGKHYLILDGLLLCQNVLKNLYLKPNIIYSVIQSIMYDYITMLLFSMINHFSFHCSSVGGQPWMHTISYFKWWTPFTVSLRDVRISRFYKITEISVLMFVYLTKITVSVSMPSVTATLT